MRIFKTKGFSRWAKDEGILDEALQVAVMEIAEGKVEASLGGHVYKKRLAKSGRGKSGGWRTLLAFRIEDKAFFVYGFAKSSRANIGTRELKVLKLLAKELLGYSDEQIAQAITATELSEVETND